MHSHVYSTVLNGSISWPWSGAMMNKVRAWEENVLRLTFRPRMRSDETWVGYRTRTSRFLRNTWKKMSHVVDRVNCEQNLDYYDAGSSRR